MTRRFILLAATALIFCGCRSTHDDVHRAIAAGDLARARQLIDRGGDLNAVDAQGVSPLITAILNERTDIALLLLQRGAAVDLKVTIAPGPLAKILSIDAGRRITVTPLMVAAAMGLRPVVRGLLDRGAAIGATGEQHITALHMAALAGRPAIARLLADRGAPLDATTDSGETPLDLAQATNQPGVAEVLELASQGNLSQPVDVAGHFAIAAHRGAETLGDIWQWGVVPLGIAVGENGAVYWTQYRTDSIERVNADGSQRSTVASDLDGPRGLTYDHRRMQLYYTADRHFPRFIAAVADDGSVRQLVHGTVVNRPFAITAAEDSGTLYWTESINGRIRSARVDGKGLASVWDDGIASSGEAPGATAMSSAGIAIHEARGLVYWTDFLASTIVRSRIDGSAKQTLLAGDSGVDFPTGLAIDPSAGKLYWADPASETIHRADLNGAHPEVFLSARDGVIEPYGLAIDAERHLLYWTDVAANSIGRANLETGKADRFVDLDLPVPERSREPANCRTATVAARRAFLKQWVKAIRTCVVNVMATRATKRRPFDLRIPARTCSGQLQRAHDDGVLRATLARHCSPKESNGLLEEIHDLGARIVFADLPRALDCLYDVRPFAEAWGPPGAPGHRDGASEIDDLVRRLEALDSTPPAITNSAVPATGQATSYVARTARGQGAEVAVGDDGTLRAGAPLSYLDNGDGTISDLNTGLMWEKKCDGCGWLHDFETAYRWHADEGQRDLSAWLAAVNSENDSGFAGHNDWRLPGADELVNLVDYERLNPAISPPFDSVQCGLDCDDPSAAGCSCTRLGAYWSATEFAGEIAVVRFNLGIVSRLSDDADAFARAVRGPRHERQPLVDNGDGTVTDPNTRLMWEKKCRSAGSLHDVDRRAFWTFDGQRQTIWDWLEAINGEDGRGFAGYQDWRIPNVKEMFSLLDYSRQSPSIDPVFAAQACAELRSPDCSSTATGMHWTSTTFADFPAHALTVGFFTGLVDDRVKTMPLAMRAVRSLQD